MEVQLDADPVQVWDAVSDVGAVHRRPCTGVLLGGRLDGESRVVTFAYGAVVRETIVDIDVEARRLVYAVVQGTLPFTHLRRHSRSAPGAPAPIWSGSATYRPTIWLPPWPRMKQGADAMQSVFNR